MGKDVQGYLLYLRTKEVISLNVLFLKTEHITQKLNKHMGWEMKAWSFVSGLSWVSGSS